MSPHPCYRLRDQGRHVPVGLRDRPAFVHRGRALTFAQLDDRADRVAAGLLAAGLVPGDRVALLLANAPETFELLVGCARAGLVAVPMNWRLAPAELAVVVADAAPRATVTDATTWHSRDVLATATPLAALELGETYEAWLAAAPDAATVPPLDDDPDRVVLQVYTSGTSGRPKGVLLTDGNLEAKVPRVAPWWGLGPAGTSLLATPLFHVGALSWGLVGLYAGTTTVLAGDADPRTLLGHLVDDGVTHTFLVPAMIARLCAAAPEGARFPDLEAIVYGASPISPQVQADALALFGPVLHQVYGMSETTGAFTEMPASADLAPGSPRWRSAGRPYPWIELEVRDPESGGRCAPYAFGEVWTRSAQNSPGYAGLPAETAALLPGDGWLRTGDGGHLDDDGYLFLTDRIKDLVISGGENISPAEVEQVLRSHPDVVDACVVGVPDERWGEAVAAAVVARAGRAPDAEDLVAYVGERVAGYKRPRYLRVVDELPRNAAGKVLRGPLRDLLAAPATPIR